MKRIVWSLVIVFMLMNVVAVFHAYKFTHFADESVAKTKSPSKLTATQKVLTLLFGVSNPRPKNNAVPARDYETLTLQSNRKIECWHIPVENPKGTVVVFHGFSGDKSKMLDKADIFLDLGYNTLLVDLMGAGGAEGNQTTIGYLEAEQVKTCCDYITSRGEKNLFIFGTSMSAAATMKAVSDHGLQPNGIILECPFGTMYQTVCARFRSMQAPTFPMAGLLVFWGGVQNGFWAFGHNPVEYAKNINCPTLLLHGGKDQTISLDEIGQVFNNLAGPKKLQIYPEAGHENYLLRYRQEWTMDVSEFLAAN